MGAAHYTDMGSFVRRSSLIFPVNVPRFVGKAYTRGADCYVMDLEDAVPDEEKDHARTLIKDSIPIVGKGGADIAVRINSPLHTAIRDLETSIWPGLTCVSLPKVERAEEIHVRDEIITELEKRRGLKLGSIQLAVTVETAVGVVNALEIACASPRIVTIGLGSEDLTREMGIEPTAEGRELEYARGKIVIDAYAAGIHPMGLVGAEAFSWDNPEKVYDAAVYSRRLGFKGAGSIHPAPIPYLNRGFSLPEEETARMRRMLEAFEEGLKKGTASVSVDGRMVDIATARRCHDFLERADAIAAFEAKKAEAAKNPDTMEKRLRAAIEAAEKEERRC